MPLDVCQCSYGYGVVGYKRMLEAQRWWEEKSSINMSADKLSSVFCHGHFWVSRNISCRLEVVVVSGLIMK